MSAHLRPEHFSLQHVPRSAAVLGIWWHVNTALGCIWRVHTECAKMCLRLLAVTSDSSMACFFGLPLDRYRKYYFEHMCPVIVQHEHFCAPWGLQPVLLNLMPLLPPDFQFSVHQTSMDQASLRISVTCTLTLCRNASDQIGLPLESLWCHLGLCEPCACLLSSGEHKEMANALECCHFLLDSPMSGH